MKRRSYWITIGVLFVSFVVWRTWVPGRSFDPDLWHSETLMQEGIRLGMADRLIARPTLKNKTRAEVVEMLGEPPETEYFRDWDLVYWLGTERGFMNIDSEWLVLRLHENGRVAECRIVRD